MSTAERIEDFVAELGAIDDEDLQDPRQQATTVEILETCAAQAD